MMPALSLYSPAASAQEERTVSLPVGRYSSSGIAWIIIAVVGLTLVILFGVFGYRSWKKRPPQQIPHHKSPRLSATSGSGSFGTPDISFTSNVPSKINETLRDPSPPKDESAESPGPVLPSHVIRLVPQRRPGGRWDNSQNITLDNS